MSDTERDPDHEEEAPSAEEASSGDEWIAGRRSRRNAAQRAKQRQLEKLKQAKGARGKHRKRAAQAAARLAASNGMIIGCLLASDNLHPGVVAVRRSNAPWIRNLKLRSNLQLCEVADVLSLQVDRHSGRMSRESLNSL